jgi:hypothetical protein
MRDVAARKNAARTRREMGMGIRNGEVRDYKAS